MDPHNGHSAWKFQYSHPVRVEARGRRISLLSWLANLVFLSGTLLFAYQLYGWFEHNEWTRYPSVVLVKYLPASCFSFLNEAPAVKASVLWLLDRADLSVVMILAGFLIAKFFVDSR